jgi:NTP pyrophosphatase (non-canonical NTP hydrolase)
MLMNQYQELADKTAFYPNKGDNIFYPTLGLAGEAGEVANKVKKIIRDYDNKITPEMKQDLIDELGDVLWFIAAISTELNVTLDEIAFYNIEKLNKRQEQKKTK